MNPQELAQVEMLAQAALEGQTEANQHLMVLQSSASMVPQCRAILELSNAPTAQMVAVSSLFTLVSQFWGNFSVEERLELREFVMTQLRERAVGMQEIVVVKLARLACRIIKLGWFDDLKFRDTRQETMAFFNVTMDHMLIGLLLLGELVEEMNLPTSGRTLTQHRKTAVSFRDHSLYKVFEVAMQTLRHMRAGRMQGTPQQDTKIVELSLKLASGCLGFDFIGTNPDESADDIQTVQVPTTWRILVVDPTTIQLFLDFYKNTAPPCSSLAMKALVQLSSARRSLFNTEGEKAVFLNALMTGIQDIMTTKHGMDFPDNYHEFCRLLGRLKTNFQLSELAKSPRFTEWLNLTAEFTIRSLQNWRYSMNSIQYLLQLWGRLVAAMPYMKTETPDTLRSSESLRAAVMRVIESYVTIMIDSVETVVMHPDIEHPLEDEGLFDQMDRFHTIARAQYPQVAQLLLTNFQQYLSQYEQVLSSTGVNPQLIEVIEGKLTWLTYMVAAIVGGFNANDPRRRDEDQKIDGTLSQAVFRLIEMLEFRAKSSGGAQLASDKLETGILYYFRMFKKVYLTEHFAGPGGLNAAAQPLLPPLAHVAPIRDKGAQEQQSPHKVFFEHLNMGDLQRVMNVVVEKLCSNIKFWRDDSDVLEATLDAFADLVSTYGSCKTLLSLETVQFLVQHHSGDFFPFLGYNTDNKHRTTFYHALSRLVFSSAEDLNNSFDEFVTPNLAILGQLSNTQDLRQPPVKIALVGALRDLRGITAATHNRRTYGLLFEALYPAAFPLFKRTAEMCYDSPEVMIALLKFLQEFAYNKGQRVQFDQSSANGILLFREVSEILCSYGSRILQMPVAHDIWKEKYKGVRLVLTVLSCTLSGGYVNFGVFSLYNDHALKNALEVSLQLCLSMPIGDVIEYPKLSKAFFTFLEILFRSHLDVLSNLESAIFLQLVKMVHQGLVTGEPPMSSLCAHCVDHLASYIFLHQRRPKPTAIKIREHLSVEPGLLVEVMSTLFQQLLFGSQSNHWAVTRPILTLTLAYEEVFRAVRDRLLQSQDEACRTKLEEEFANLMNDVQQSTETTNRDKFTQRLTIFRWNVRSFICC